jgi:hypothetical protein
MKRKQAGLPPALAHFDDLPDSAYVPGTVVDGLRGFSRWTRIRRVKDGTLPAPVQTSPGCWAFNVGKLRQAFK